MGFINVEKYLNIELDEQGFVSKLTRLVPDETVRKI